MLDGEIVSRALEDGMGELSEKEVKGRVSYFYSKADRMCLWSDVRHHADKARMLGWDVREVVFEGSGHCAHFTNDPGKYSDAVRSIWGGEFSWGVRREMSKL